MAESSPPVPSQSHPIVSAEAPARLPKVTIQFCTQCKWMLRAAYFAQELLSTFSTSLGEVALQPATGGTFTVTLTHLPLQAYHASGSESGPISAGEQQPTHTLLWDRKTEGGFPETKELKRRVRDIIQPSRDLGHVDRHSGTTKVDGSSGAAEASPSPLTTMSSSEPSKMPDPQQPSQPVKDQTPADPLEQRSSQSVDPLDEPTTATRIPVPPSGLSILDNPVQSRTGAIMPLGPNPPGAEAVLARIEEANRRMQARKAAEADQKAVGTEEGESGPSCAHRETAGGGKCEDCE